MEQIESECPSMHGEQRGTPPLHHEQTEHRSLDEEEEKKITEFINTGCGCTLNIRSHCSSVFSKKHYATMRADAFALTWNELNLAVMSEVMALTVMEKTRYTTVMVAIFAEIHLFSFMGWEENLS